MALRRRLDIVSGDREICVGDIIAKGPKSRAVLHFCKENDVTVIRGNHEDKIVRYHRHEMERLRTGKRNPMKLDEEVLALYASMSDEDIAYLDSLPLFVRMGKLTVVHAGILPATRLESLDKKGAAQIMRVRYLNSEGNFVHLDASDPARHFWWSDLYDGRYGYVVYGHQPFLYPRVDRWSFGIDTGAVYGNRLTAIVFDYEDEPIIESYRFADIPTPAYTQKKRGWIVADS